MNANLHTTSQTPSTLKVWSLAIRPQTLLAAFVPVAVGSACAWHEGAFLLLPAVACFLGAFFLQVGTNLANDVFDYEKGADNEERVGPARVVQSGWLSSAQVKRAMWISFGLAFWVGLYLVSVASLWILAIGICSIFAAYAYTGGPFPLAYHGLGEVFVLIFFGFVAVCGTAFVHLGRVPELAWFASVPVGFLAMSILAVNNYRDRYTDPKAGKRTLAVRWGGSFAKLEYLCFLTGSFAMVFLIWGYFQLSPIVLLPMIVLPWAIKLMRDFLEKDGTALNAVLVGTAKLLFVFGVLFSLGLALSKSPNQNKFTTSPVSNGAGLRCSPSEYLGYSSLSSLASTARPSTIWQIYFDRAPIAVASKY